MKNLVLLTLLWMIWLLLACNHSGAPTTAAIPSPNEAPPDTLEYLDLSPEQRQDLDSAERRWYRAGMMDQCAPSKRFKMDCYDCESKTVAFTAHVNETGQIDQWLHIQAAVRCRKHDAKAIQVAEDCLKANIQHLVLTPAFANRWVKLQIGHALGC